MKSIYEELGGDSVLEAASSKLFERVLGDPFLQLYFEHTNPEKIRAAFKSYVAMLLGAPTKYVGKTLHEVHKGTQINDLAFDSFVDLFVHTLKDMGVRDDLVVQIAGKLSPLKNDVVDSFNWTGRHFYAPSEPRGR